MYAVADTTTLVSDGVIDERQATEIEARSRQSMVALAVNVILLLGILSATGGLIFWLEDPVPVAVFGLVALALGFAILVRASTMLRMFGNSAALIGAGMLAGGASLELVANYPDAAGWVMLAAGGVLGIAAALVYAMRLLDARFVVGAICLIGLVMHLGGGGFLIAEHAGSGPVVSLFYLYCALLMAAVGWLLDVRLVSALAIVPFAQVLETGTFYWHAVYAFYSPEPTLTILQMSALIVLCLIPGRHYGERTARHTRVLAVLAFVVANLSALVGSLFGDVVGDELWGPHRSAYADWDAYKAALEAFRANALVIPEAAYSIIWAVALVAMILWSAHRNIRGLFNTSVVFGVLHAYTQLFESFGDEPLAYVIGGLALIPIAWGMWRFDAVLKERSAEIGAQDG